LRPTKRLILQDETPQRRILKALGKFTWHCLPSRRRARLALAVIRRADPDVQRSVDSLSLSAALSLLKENGFAPGLIVDVGANRGLWTIEAQCIFPTARFFLVDADPANAESLHDLCASLPRCTYLIALLGAECRADVLFWQMGTGSSVLPERSEFDRNRLRLPMTTLDSELHGNDDGAVLIKLDVQGYELEVLKGASTLLSRAEVIILECSLIEYNEGAPLFADVVEFMSAHGFVAYDFFGQNRRESDGALFQFDAVFVKSDSMLRRAFSRWHLPGSLDGAERFNGECAVFPSQ
jgi:FkbM family methyltransferase